MTRFTFDQPPNVQPVLRWQQGEAVEQLDELADEEPLELRVRGRSISITMRTPGEDAELATGFLFTEGIVRQASDIWRIDPCLRDEEGNRLNVQLAPEVHVDFQRLTRHVFASSSCGLCGKASIDALCEQFEPVRSDVTIDVRALSRMPDMMREAQATFQRTGGLHAAALFDADGELVVVREDVGRHNAVDKVVGHALRKGMMPLDQHVMLVSGRASFEIMQKALAARLPVVAAVSAPSSLAARFAEAAGQTLVGFLRDERMNIYTHPRRITLDLPTSAA